MAPAGHQPGALSAGPPPSAWRPAHPRPARSAAGRIEPIRGSSQQLPKINTLTSNLIITDGYRCRGAPWGRPSGAGRGHRLLRMRAARVRAVSGTAAPAPFRSLLLLQATPLVNIWTGENDSTQRNSLHFHKETEQTFLIKSTSSESCQGQVKMNLGRF